MPIFVSEPQAMMSGVTTRTNPAPVSASLRTRSSSTSWRRAPALPQLPQAPAAVAHELAFEGLEGGVAGRGAGEELVEHQRVGAELAQALRLRRREADAEGIGLVRRHDASSSPSGTRAR